jgi:hypothetical protein
MPQSSESHGLGRVKWAVTGLLVWLAGMLVLYEFLAARQADLEVAAGYRQIHELMNRLRDARLRGSQAERARRDWTGKVAKLQAAAAQAGAAARNSRLPPGIYDGAAFLVAHPEVKAAFTANMRANIAILFGPLFRSLRLGPEEIAAFEDVMLAAGSRTLLGGEKDGTRVTYEFSTADSAVSPQDTEAQIRGVLGADGYAQYCDFQTTARMRGSLGRAAQQLYFKSEPLTSAQTEQLAQIARQAQTSGGSTLIEGMPWDAVIDGAQAVLSPAQLEALRGLRQQAYYMQLQSQAMMQEARKSGSP